MGDFSDRLKKFLKSEKNFVNCHREYWISEDIEKTLCKETPTAERVACLKDLEEILVVKKFSERGVIRIFGTIRDLLEPNIPKETRHAALRFLSLVCLSDDMGNGRMIFYHFILESQSYEDTAELFKFFRATIKHGKDIEDLEGEIPAFIVMWLPELLASSLSSTEVIKLCSDLLKYHGLQFSNQHFEELSNLACNKILGCSSQEEMDDYLNFLDSIVQYGRIPSEALGLLCCTLAKICNVPSATENACKIMNRQMVTMAANTTMKTICHIIETTSDAYTTRGCVYFITRCAWSSLRSPTLNLTPLYALPFLFKTCQSIHPTVVSETAISIHKLILNCYTDLHRASWEEIFVIINHLAYFADNHNTEQAQNVMASLDESMYRIEYFIERDMFHGPLDLYYSLVEHYSTRRPIQHVKAAMDYKLELLRPAGKWIPTLKSCIHKHFKVDQRLPVRLYALKKLESLFYKFRYEHGEQFVQEIVLTQLDSIASDSDMTVRIAASKLLLDICLRLRCPVVSDLLLLVEKIVLRAYNFDTLQPPPPMNDEQVEDILAAVTGLVSFFKQRIWVKPSSHAITAYSILMNSLEYHYRKPDVLANASSIRRVILEMVFEMRADVNYHLGVPNCEEASITFSECSTQFGLEMGKYTPFIIVDHRFGQKPTAEHLQHKFPQLDFDAAEQRAHQVRLIYDAKLKTKQATSEDTPPQTDIAQQTQADRVTHLSLSKAARVVIVALKNELDWPVLKLILEKLPEVLQNKALILSKDGNDVDYLAMTLCDMVIGKRTKAADTLTNTPLKFTPSDLNSYIYPVLSRLASYHQDLEYSYQINVIKCLQYGMLSKSSPQCVSAMTVCVFEMKRAMIKQLREVMLALSKISATVHNAQPTLEFLSTLLHLPRIYSDFLSDQYLSVFAITIPYTNPFKFNHYVVSLAHHVIAMWFLSCRLHHRKAFVHFIAKNLHTMVSQEAAIRRNDPRNTSEEKAKIEQIVQFHSDLRETSVDFMARYCFDTYSPDPKRSEVAEMLVQSGKKRMWLVGTRIITMTTSGCSEKGIKNGICEKCHSLCMKVREAYQKLQQEQCEPTDSDPNSNRRRHRSEYNRSVSHEITSEPQSKDDLHMESGPPKLQSFLSQEGAGATPSTPLLHSGQTESENEVYTCACWCKGWAEISIKQPTGSTAWIMRLLNSPTLEDMDESMPIHELSSLYNPSQQPPNMFPMANMDYQEFLTTFQTNAEHIEQTGTLSPNWSSGQSSKNTSRASSELKLNQTLESDSHPGPVVCCSSNPEVNVKLSSEGGITQGKTEALLTSDAKFEALSRAAAHSEFANLPQRTSVRRSNSIVETSSNSAVSNTRTRHTSALQMKSVSSSSADADDLQPMKRGRGHTISEINPASRSGRRGGKFFQRRPTVATSGLATNATSTSSLQSMSAASSMETISQTTGVKAEPKSNKGGISPSSTLLQLFYQGNTGPGWNRPIVLPIEDADLQRSVKLLDYIKPQENHKIGVLYVRLGQSTESEILSNSCGPARYRDFLRGLGTIHELENIPDDTFLGGLDRRGGDGKTVYMWQDHIMQVVFHVATNMPNTETDGTYINKKRLVGNNYVTIVYNNSLLPYDLHTLRSQFNHSVVEIIPGDHNTNRVQLLCKPEVGELMSWKATDAPRLVSDASLPVLARQLAVHANLASMVYESIKRETNTPYATNWLERLRKIRKIREKVLGEAVAREQLSEQQTAQLDGDSEHWKFIDFSDMIAVPKSEPKERARNISLLNWQ